MTDLYSLVNQIRTTADNINLQRDAIDSLIQYDQEGKKLIDALRFIQDVGLQGKVVDSIIEKEASGSSICFALEHVQNVPLQRRIVWYMIHDDKKGEIASTCLILRNSEEQRWVEDPFARRMLVNSMLFKEPNIYVIFSLSEAAEFPELQTELVNYIIANDNTGDYSCMSISNVKDLYLRGELVNNVIEKDNDGNWSVIALGNVRDNEYLQELLVDSIIEKDKNGQHYRSALDEVTSPKLQRRLTCHFTDDLS
jgi:hypothetical protein